MLSLNLALRGKNVTSADYKNSINTRVRVLKAIFYLQVLLILEKLKERCAFVSVLCSFPQGFDQRKHFCVIACCRDTNF